MNAVAEDNGHCGAKKQVLPLKRSGSGNFSRKALQRITVISATYDGSVKSFLHIGKTMLQRITVCAARGRAQYTVSFKLEIEVEDMLPLAAGPDNDFVIRDQAEIFHHLNR